VSASSTIFEKKKQPIYTDHLKYMKTPHSLISSTEVHEVQLFSDANANVEYRELELSMRENTLCNSSMDHYDNPSMWPKTASKLHEYT
jgi:hypothetical protein